MENCRRFVFLFVCLFFFFNNIDSFSVRKRKGNCAKIRSFCNVCIRTLIDNSSRPISARDIAETDCKDSLVSAQRNVFIIRAFFTSMYFPYSPVGIKWGGGGGLLDNLGIDV